MPLSGSSSVRLWLCLAPAVLLTPVSALAETFKLDPAHTTVAFLVEHVGFARTLGHFSAVDGSFDYDEATGTVSNVRVTVKTDSVQSDNKARDKHVRSKDFLDVRQHPAMEFTSAESVLDADGKGALVGELSLLGQTKPLVLAVSLNKADTYPFGHRKYTLGVSATGALKRSDFGMSYAVGNGLVGDDVELIIEIEAIQE